MSEKGIDVLNDFRAQNEDADKAQLSLLVATYQMLKTAYMFHSTPGFAENLKQAIHFNSMVINHPATQMMLSNPFMAHMKSHMPIASDKTTIDADAMVQSMEVMQTGMAASMQMSIRTQFDALGVGELNPALRAGALIPGLPFKSSDNLNEWRAKILGVDTDEYVQVVETDWATQPS